MIPFFIVSIVLELAVLFSSFRLYPLIHAAFFSHLPEAEVQLYFFSTFVAVFLLSAWYFISYTPFVERMFSSGFRIKKIVPFPLHFIVFPLVLFFPIVFAKLIFPGSQIQKDLENLSYGGMTQHFNFGLYYFFLVSCFLYFYRLYGVAVNGRAKHRNTALVYMAYFAMALCIFILTFHVGYLSIYDISFYAGPINFVRAGIPLLTFPSLYGFLSIAALSILFHFIPLTLLNFTILTGLAVFAGFLLYFFIARLLYRHASYAFFVTVFAIFANWLVAYGSRNTLPQTTVLRFGMWLPLALIIYFKNQTKSPRLLRYLSLVELLTVTVVFFWSVDVGMYVLVAYSMYLWFQSLEPSMVSSLKSFLRKMLMPMGCIAGGFACINLLYLVMFGTPPQWKYFVGLPFYYLSTFWLLPMPQSIVPWLVLSPSWLVITYVLFLKRRQNTKLANAKLSVITFIAFYDILQFTYMMGRSTLSSLHALVLPFILCFFFLIERLLYKAKMIFIVLISFVLSYILYFSVGQGILNLRSENILTTIGVIRHPRGTETELFGPTVDLVNRKYGQSIQRDGLAIVSVHDTWYTGLFRKANQIGSPTLFYYFTPEQIAPLVDTIQRKKFHYVFVDHDKTQNFGQVSWIFDAIKAKYQYKETLGLLDVYELL